MNAYDVMRQHQRIEYNNFPLHFAFGEEQIERKFAELGLDREKDLDKIVVIPHTGGFMLKKDRDAFLDMNKRHSEEFQNAIAEDKTGDGFILDMFISELSNNEFGYDEEMAVHGALRTLGLTLKQICENKALNFGFEKAKKTLREASEV